MPAQVGIDRDLAQLAALLPPLLHAPGDSEHAVATIWRWLEREARQGLTIGWEQDLPVAVQTGRTIYEAFTGAFFAFFGAPSGEGDRALERALRRHFAYGAERLTDEAQKRILGRLDRLLDHFCTRYQVSLFGALCVELPRIPGYLVQVARFESRKVDLRDPLFHLGGQVELTRFAEEEVEPGPTVVGQSLRNLKQQLGDFWNGHGFTERERLEGLVSHLLGDLTGKPVLQRRCRRFLQRRAVALAPEEEQLAQRISVALVKLQDVQEQLVGCRSKTERAKLAYEIARRQERLARFRRRRAQLVQRLLPRPAQVQRLLRGCVGNAAMARFSRIEREIGILRERVQKGRAELAGGPMLSDELLTLLADTQAHMATSPPWRIPAADRAASETRARWLSLGQQLLDRIRHRRRALHEGRLLTEALRVRLEGFLMDLELLYDCGLLRHKGLAGALGEYPERWLRHTLRS